MKKFNLFCLFIIIFLPINSNSNKKKYIELMKSCLTGLIYQDDGFQTKFNSETREEGLDRPSIAHTMIGLKRINNIQFCIEKILKNKIPGDLIETGVWRGGAVIFMKAMLAANNVNDRIVWVADSFEGLPAANVQKYPEDKEFNFLHEAKELKISLKTVKNNFRKYNLLDNKVKFLKGWFKDTLPKAPIKKLALLRLDGDLYESTMDALVNLYPKLSVGGYIIIDDYGVSTACAKAVHDYRKIHKINNKMITIDSSGAVYWKKKI